MRANVVSQAARTSTRGLSNDVSLDVVIVAYQSRELLRDCLTSLRQHRPRVPSRIFLVDNGSTDGTVTMVREQFPEVDLDEGAANVGFSRANNAAITRGTSKYVLVLNPDTRIGEGALDTLLALMEAHPEIGISGCRLELEDGSLDHAAKRSFPTPLGALGHFTGIGRRRGAPAGLAQYRAPSVDAGPVDAVNGAFMLIRRSALDEVGLFDEGYWMYMEDLDLCYRFAQAGWIVWYEPSVTVIHVKAGSSGRNRSPRLNYAFHYGMFRFYRTHYAKNHPPVVNAFIYVGIAAKLGISVVRSAVNRRLAARLPSAFPSKER
jgi:N-acetylglucosaminyl-diphospho-decaprenol L-rhamnosyltransferase